MDEAEKICQHAYSRILKSDLSCRRKIKLWNELPDSIFNISKEAYKALIDICKVKLNYIINTESHKELNVVANSILNMGLVGCCVFGSVLLMKSLEKIGISSKVVCGFGVQPVGAYRHAWVELSNGNNLDIGDVVYRLSYPQLMSLPNPTLVVDLPQNMERFDQDTEDEKRELMLLELSITALNDGIPNYITFLENNNASKKIINAINHFYIQ